MCLVLLEESLALVRKSIIVSVRGPRVPVPRDLGMNQNREVSWVIGRWLLGAFCTGMSTAHPLLLTAIRKISRAKSFASQLKDA